MSMKRKLLREQARYFAEQHGYKASVFVNKTWDRIQEKTVGRLTRDKNVCRGTHKKATWKMRYTINNLTIHK